MTPKAKSEPRVGPLAHLRVISVAEQYPGPFATMLMADLGADVIQVERPAGGDPTRGFEGFHSSLARGKRSVVLDLKDAEDHSAFLRLVETADVLFEGFRPGTMDRLGLGYQALNLVNPRLVYISISGFGQDGPYRDRPGHDMSYQALAGMLYPMIESPARRVAPEVALADLSAGLLGFAGALVGLLDVEAAGHGHYIDVSMFDGLTSLLSAHLGPVANSTGPGGFPYEPGYGMFTTQDGEILAIGVAHEDHFWRGLCAAVGLDEESHLCSSERFAAAGRLSKRLRELIAAKPVAHWSRELEKADVPFGVVCDLAGALDDPHVVARELVVTVDASDESPARRYVRQPFVIDGARLGPSTHAPALGAHTAEVLRELDGLLAPRTELALVDDRVVAEAKTSGDRGEM